MNILSRYVLREFLSFLWYTILAFAVIFILVDLVENVDDFIDDKIYLRLIVLYYIFSLPYIILLTFPVAMLLSTMFSLGRLVGDNEITAMKASGVSLYRILLPLYVFAFIMGFVNIFFAETVVPRANIFSQDIREMGNDYRFTLSRVREMDRYAVPLANGDNRIIYAQAYKSRSKTAENVFIIEPVMGTVTESDTVLTNIPVAVRERIDAKTMTYANGGWLLRDVTVRTFTEQGEIREHHDILPAPFILRKPSDFATIELKPEEMDYFQLRDYIHQVRDKGGNASEWRVDLFMKISFPFIAFVIVFFGAPMTAGTTGTSKTAAFGIALAIAFIYYALVNASQILGRTGALNPFIAAWLPNCLFFCVGGVMLYRAKK